MDKTRCITFDPAAQEALPDHIKAKMKADRDSARAIKKIGIDVRDVIAGTEVYYYPWIDHQHHTHAEPIKVTIRHTQVWQSGREWVCSVKGVTGCLSIRHLQLIQSKKIGNSDLSK